MISIACLLENRAVLIQLQNGKNIDILPKIYDQKVFFKCFSLQAFIVFKSSEILRVSSVSVLFAGVSEALDDLGFTYWKADLHRGRKQR